MEKQVLNEKQCSIELTKNSKGYTWSCKIYYDEEKRDPQDVIRKLGEIDSTLKAKYGGE